MARYFLYFLLLRKSYLFDHADLQALLESTELAAVSSTLIYRASPLGQAYIFRALLHSPFEETLTSLARTHAIMLTGRGVAAHSAKLARTRGCSFTAGTTSGRRRTDGRTRDATAATAAWLRGLCAPTTVNTIQDAHRSIAYHYLK
jgi:hypothetical protein